jgi:hypothetical protein
MRDAEAEGRGGSRPSIVVGRVAAVVFTALYFFFIVRTGDASREFVVLAVLLGLAALAAVLAWYSSSRGALALAAAGLSLAVFGGVVASHDQVYVALLLGSPYLLTATLLWFGSTRIARA